MHSVTSAKEPPMHGVTSAVDLAKHGPARAFPCWPERRRSTREAGHTTEADPLCRGRTRSFRLTHRQEEPIHGMLGWASRAHLRAR